MVPTNVTNARQYLDRLIREVSRNHEPVEITGTSKDKAEVLLHVLADDPSRTPPRYERLIGNLAGAYSRRINIHHTLVYQVIAEERVAKVLLMWAHYE